ncbi:MAG TPA: trypsin-like peptidase domain-containing protein [Acidimicrobiales bacterium]|nr:trypsin-like peptidase domain-containing protein [Acidimicrobiales bacterium]
MTKVLEELSDAIAGLADGVGPSVVGVGRGGSGVVVGEGRVLTNAHNLRGGEVTVTFPDGRRAEATPLGVDVEGDLAVLSVETAGAPAVPWGAPAPRVGSAVVALAHNRAGGARASVGFVSATGVTFRGPGGRLVEGAIEHTAPLARGASGGPVVDAAGRLLGIDTHRVGDGAYLAVAADEGLRARVDALGRGESPTRRRLGVAVAPRHVARRLRRSVGLAERDGVLVLGVEEGGPAARAGIGRGDLIVAVADTAVSSVDDLASALADAPAGTPVTVAVVRGADERTVAVDLEGNGTAHEGSV